MCTAGRGAALCGTDRQPYDRRPGALVLSRVGGKGGDFEGLGKWDRRGGRARSAQELVGGLEGTCQGMQAAIAGWSAAQWAQTWPGESWGEPGVITRQWVIWHLIEHDLHHGGEISLTLGMHGKRGLSV